MRLGYPGACSLEFQSVMQILTECLLQWDIKKKISKKRGILGTVIAYSAADEEQGRKTLHRHWQIWIKEMDETLRKCLFHEDITIRNSARSTFCNMIDHVIMANYGSQFHITHKCNCENKAVDTGKQSDDRELKEQDPCVFRQLRHKELCTSLGGKVMMCSNCLESKSTSDIIDQNLLKIKNNIIQGDRLQHHRPDTILPISKERLDMAAYLYSYHMDHGCAMEKDKLWGNETFREALLKKRFEEHSHHHKPSCFKKGPECRFMFPFPSNAYTYIHEDRGEKNENEVLQYSLNGSTTKIYPFMAIPKRPMGCQYINQHNAQILKVLNCNTNIQIGDTSQVYYSTLYTSKSTQEEDSEKQLRIGHAVIKRIKRLIDSTNITHSSNNKTSQDISEASFSEGLCRVLSGLNAATTRNVISSTMAHLIPSNGGSRFIFSHDFSDLLVSQMEATLEGQETHVRIRTQKLANGQINSWADSLADDYIHRPMSDNFETICFHEMTRWYKKKYKTMPKVKQQNEEETHEFSTTHPGHDFSHLIKLQQETIPRISLPKHSLCPIKDLQLNTTNPTEECFQKREKYAKMALIMFYPFRCLQELKTDNSFWTTFFIELQKHLKGEDTKFWEKGFDILQNINDRTSLDKEIKRARDPINMKTHHEEIYSNKKRPKTINETVENDILQIATDYR